MTFDIFENVNCKMCNDSSLNTDFKSVSNHVVKKRKHIMRIGCQSTKVKTHFQRISNFSHKIMRSSKNENNFTAKYTSELHHISTDTYLFMENSVT